MGTVIYSVLTMLEDNPQHTNICALLEQDPHYNIRRLGLNPVQAADMIGQKRPHVILVFSKTLPLMLKSWIRRIAEKEGIPFVLLCENGFNSAEFAATEKLVQHYPLAATDAAATVVRDIGIKVRLAANQTVASRMTSEAQHREEHPQLPHNPAAEPGAAAPLGGKTFDKRKLIAIGASMGGVEAVGCVLGQLPADMPGIVVVQHMPKGFTDMFAKRMDLCCKLKVVQAENNQKIVAGTAYIAPGEQQMTICNSPDGYYFIRISDGERVSGHKPSVDVLFRSVAKSAGKNALGVILTGMGDDGARGLAELRETGADTIGQDAATALVYGMPKVAFELGAVRKQMALGDIPNYLVEYANKK